jgi:hypothetical protein
MGAAARTPTVTAESYGSMKLVIATFTVIDDTDTWTSGIKGAVGYWCNGTDDPTTQASNAIDVSYVSSTGVFTFNCGEDDRAGKLYVLTKS